MENKVDLLQIERGVRDVGRGRRWKECKKIKYVMYIYQLPIMNYKLLFCKHLPKEKKSTCRKKIIGLHTYELLEGHTKQKIRKAWNNQGRLWGNVTECSRNIFMGNRLWNILVEYVFIFLLWRYRKYIQWTRDCKLKAHKGFCFGDAKV